MPAVVSGRKSELRALWKHFSSIIAKKQGKTENRLDSPWTSRSGRKSPKSKGKLDFAFNKLLRARRFHCLKLSKALTELTLPTKLSLALMRRSLSPALLRSLSLVFSLSHFPYQNSRPTFVSRVSAVNPGREMRV